LSHGSSQIAYFKSDVDDTNRPVSAGWLQLQECVTTYLKVRQRRSAIVAEGERFLEAKSLCAKPDSLVQISSLGREHIVAGSNRFVSRRSNV